MLGGQRGSRAAYMRMAVWPLRVVLPGADQDTPFPVDPEYHPHLPSRQL